MRRVRWMSAEGEGAYRVVGHHVVADPQEAFSAAVERYTPMGYTKLKLVNDDDPGTYRVTGTTPGGRAGRNLAYVDFDWPDGEDADDGSYY